MSVFPRPTLMAALSDMRSVRLKARRSASRPVEIISRPARQGLRDKLKPKREPETLNQFYARANHEG